MALVRCPDCRKEISDSAPACIHCGRPMGVGKKAEEVGQSGTASGSSTLPRCSQCGSDDVRTLPLVHAEGTSTLKATTVGAGFDGDIGVVGASTSGTQRTLLARRAAPPQRMKDKTAAAFGFGCLSGCLVYFVAAAALGVGANASEDKAGVAMLVSAIAMVAIVSVIAIPGSREANKYNAEQFPSLLAKWQRSVLCMRCGNVTDPVVSLQ